MEKMTVLDLVQGSAEWLAHRKQPNIKNASDAPAMMNASKYISRNDFVRKVALGIEEEVSPEQQKRFNDGHRFEALARPLAESIIGDDLYPVTGLRGDYSASFDGISMDYSNLFEHKSLNNALRACKSADDLSLDYKIQMEQQLLVSGAPRCLFIASKWSDEDVMIEEVHFWYDADLELRKRIIEGWKQFDIDVANYVEAETVEAEVVEEISSLPAVVISASGELSKSNLEKVIPRYEAFLFKADEEIESISIENGKAIGKFSREAAANLKASAVNVIAQIETVSDAINKMNDFAKKFDAMGLRYEKAVDIMVKAEADSAINKVIAEYQAHLSGLIEKIKPIRWNLVAPNFQTCLKNLRTPESKNNALASALANAKAEATIYADEISEKYNWWNEQGMYEFLFPDLQQIIAKPLDDFKNLVTSRIATHKANEATKQKQEEAAPTATASKLIAESFEPAQKIEISRSSVINLVADTYGMKIPAARAWLLKEFSGK